MNDKRRMLVLAAAAAPMLARGQDKPAPQPGRDYLVLRNPQPVESGNKVEILDFFQYSCPHCFHFLPELQAWKRRLPADVDYRYLPCVFNEATTPHAKILYTLVAMNKIDALHAKVFSAIQVEHRQLLDPNDIADFMAKEGIDREQWTSTFNSFGVASRVNRAGQVWRAYQVDGTPELGVDGRFMTSPTMVNSATGSLQVMDYLIDLSRKTRAAKA